MIKQRFFIKPPIRDNIEEIVIETLNAKIDLISQEEFIATLEKGLDEKYHNDGSMKPILGGLLTAGLYDFYLAGKMAAQLVLIKSIKNKLKTDMPVRNAMIEFLESPIGQTDSHSFKYLVLHNLFGFEANKGEASMIVEYSIKALKGQGDTYQLKNTNNN